MEEQKDIFDFIEKRKTEMPDQSYFENLSKSVIASQEKKKAKIVPLFKRPATWLSVAAAAVLVFMVVKFNSPADVVFTDSDSLAGLDDVSREEILAYVNDNIDDFDVELIAEFVPANQLDDDYSDLESELFEDQEEDPIESVSFDNITKEDILEYLEEDDLDFSDLDDEDSFI